MNIRQIGESEYNEFCQQFEGATFFHSIEWHCILQEAYKIKMIYLGFFIDSSMVGVMPVMSRRFISLSIYGSPLPKLSTPDYVFPLFSRVESTEVLKMIDKWVKEKRWKYLQMSWPYSTTGQIKDESRFTAEIDLNQPLEDIWKLTKKWMRKRIRHATHNKVRIHPQVTERYLCEYPRLLHFTYRILQGISPNTPLIVFNEIRKKLGELPLRVFTATHNGNVVAMLWFSYDKDNCYLWEVAADATARELSANHLLHWEVIRWAHKQGFKKLDMVGGGPSRGGKCGNGIIWFKQGFGVQFNEIKVLYWQPKWVNILLQTYRRYLRFKDRPKISKKPLL